MKKGMQNYQKKNFLISLFAHYAIIKKINLLTGPVRGAEKLGT
jgi:hypothetical protein